MNLPKTAYILLWFPKPSETFVFGEVLALWKMGLPLKVFTLYGELGSGLSEEMQRVSAKAERLGVPFLKTAHKEVSGWRKRNSLAFREVLNKILFRRWRGLEKTGENLWAIMCAFYLARRFEEEGIEHIHAPWACGCATAAWAASMLTGIPFSFTGRAWDIRPHDGALGAKAQAAAFVRCDSAHNIDYMAGFLGGDASKVHLVYNGMNLDHTEDAPVAMKPPYKLLAIGRLVKKKGFDYLISACKMLKSYGVDFRLSIVGDGPRMAQLKLKAKMLRVTDRVSLLGHIPHDGVSRLIRDADIFMVPSRVNRSGDSDGLPTVLSEAMIHRVPVIATDVAGIPDLVQDRVTGLLIPQQNPEAIAQAVMTMTRDRESALKMAEKGRERVLDVYDSDRNHRAILELIRNHSSSTRGSLPVS